MTRLPYPSATNNVPTVVARRVASGLLLALALSAATAAPAAACTQDEYLTEEQRQSGQYDSRPSEWETQWGGGGPHTHSGAPAPTEQPAPGAAPSAGAPAGAGSTEVVGAPAASSGSAPARTRSVERRRAPARSARPKPDAAPAPVAPVTSEQTAIPAPKPAVRHAHPLAAVTPAPVRAARAGASKRPRTAARHPRNGKEPRRPSIGARSAGPAVAHPTVVAAPASDGASDLPLGALLAAVALVAGGALLLRRRRPPEAPVVAAPAASLDYDDAAVEAELQEMLAEERARRELGPPVGPRV